MITPLRRAHLRIWIGLAVLLPAGLITARGGRARLPAPSPPGWSAAPLAAAAWPVGADTLYLELARAPATDSFLVRAAASGGARWPDAVLSWSPADAAATDTLVLGVVAAGAPLTAVLPAAGGRFHLTSPVRGVLGGWRSPLPVVPKGR
jgi:hypothetical protein